MKQPGGQVATIPSRVSMLAPEEFHWAVLTAGDLHARPALLASLVRHQSPALLTGVAKVVPTGEEDLHAAFVVHREPGLDPVVIACAMPGHRLAGVITPDSVALLPAGWPQPIVNRFTSLPTVPPAALNMLTGAWTPRAIRRGRRLAVLTACASMIIITALLAVGLERRSRWFAQRSEATAAAADAVRARLSGTPDLPLARQRLRAETARLQLAANPPVDPADPDAADALAALLSRWPAPDEVAGQFVRVQSVQIAPTSMVMTLLQNASADQQRLTSALSSVPGWKLQPAQRTMLESAATNGGAVSSEARLVLRFVAERGARP